MFSIARSITMLVLSFVALAGCNNRDSKDVIDVLSDELTVAITAAGPGMDVFALPDEKALNEIPADPANPLTPEKVALGQMLYHKTGLATNSNDMACTGTYSCATCHHSSA